MAEGGDAVSAILLAFQKTIAALAVSIENETVKQQAINDATRNIGILLATLAAGAPDSQIHDMILDALDAKFKELAGRPVPKKCCAWCKHESVPLMRCSGCMKVRYCSVECQKHHRKEHKPDCKKGPCAV